MRVTLPRRIGAAGFLLCLTAVLAITLNRTTVDEGRGEWVEFALRVLHRVGFPDAFGYAHLEFMANVVMFVPLGVLLALALDPSRRWIAAIALPLFSVGVELFQFFFLPARYATISDVIANSIGAWIGVGAVVMLSQFYSRRRRNPEPSRDQMSVDSRV